VSGAWQAGVRAAASRSTLAYVGPGTTYCNRLIDVGANVVAAVAVVPEGVPMPDPPSAPTHTLIAATRSGLDLQAETFGRTLELAASGVSAFLDEHDPGQDAAVVGVLGVPSEAIGARPPWVSGAAIARDLECKHPTSAVLDGVLPWIPGEAAPAHPDERWWRDTTSRMATDRLVLQRAGLSSGGAGTWCCSSWSEAAAALASCPTARVSPFVDGVSANVMGCVTIDGTVIAFPPTRQLMVTEGDGQQVYVGNVAGGRWVEGLEEMTDHARCAGSAMAAMGFVGPFGIDALVGDDGPRYHDLNARLNGAAHAFDLDQPVVVGLMLAEAWMPAAGAASVEAELHRAVGERPIARWWLTGPVSTARTVGPVPAAGLHRIDPAVPATVLIESDPSPDPLAVAGDVAFLRPRTVPHATLLPGDRLVLADLWCTPELSDELFDHHGDQALPRLVTAFQAAAPAV
jgi:hypothetical protein